jgi:membrane associated rhomboid family serine protease
MKQSNNSSRLIQAIYELWVMFKPLVRLFVAVWAISLAFLMLAKPPLINFWVLAETSSQPWGALTGIFIHLDNSQLFSNMVFFGVLLIAFFGMSYVYPPELNLKKSRFLAVDAFLCAVIANVCSIIFMPTILSAGSSGLVYAVNGAVLAEGTVNILLLGIRLTNHRLVAFFMDNVVVAGLFAYLVLTPSLNFFNVAPEINSFAHIVGFATGFASMLTFEVYFHLKHKKEINAHLRRWGQRNPLNDQPSQT